MLHQFFAQSAQKDNTKRKNDTEYCFIEQNTQHTVERLGLLPTAQFINSRRGNFLTANFKMAHQPRFTIAKVCEIISFANHCWIYL